MALNPGQRTHLADTLNCTEAELDGRLAKFAEAAREEYETMLLGTHVFTRGADLKEYRLLLLIRHVYDMRLPSVEQISGAFKLTASQSRTLLRSVLAKYQYELRTATNDTIQAVLAAATPDPNDSAPADKKGKVVSVENLNIVEEINRRITKRDASLPPLTKVPNTSARYVISKVAYTRLTS